jgi:sugar phosphate isomerase/epimerase
MRAAHERNGVRASMLGLWGWNHLDLDRDKRAEAHAMLDRAIGFAKTLKADVFVTGGGQIPGEPVGRSAAEFLKIFPPFLDKIRAAGMKPAFYAVHGASFFDGIEAFERVWEQMPDVAIKFDPANWRHHGDDYLSILHRYGNKIGYVHVKEHLYDAQGKLASQPPAGMGDIAWGKVLAFLYEHDYRGWLSIEPHGPIWSRGAMREKMLLITKKYLSQFHV